MNRLRRKFFKLKKPVKSIDSGRKEEEDIYLEPQYDESSIIVLHIDAIAEELLTIAKKSVRKLDQKTKPFLSS